MVNNIGATSASMKNNDEVGFQNQVEKFIESFNKSSIEMSTFISNKMATSLSEDQLTAMIKNISTNANNSLRDGDAIDGLKIMVADNIKSQIRTLSDLKVGSLSTNGDWEARTEVSKKYEKVELEEILKILLMLVYN